MLPRLEFTAGLTATCCSTLQYLEGAAYIAIVLAVLGVPQLLTYYFDQRERRRTRAEERAEAERTRQEEPGGTRSEIRREERADTERRHQEMMTALADIAAMLERNGHAAPEQSAVIAQLQSRIAELEAENALLRNSNGSDPPPDAADVK